MNSVTLWVTFLLKKCREAENSRTTDAVCVVATTSTCKFLVNWFYQVYSFKKWTLVLLPYPYYYLLISSGKIYRVHTMQIYILTQPINCHPYFQEPKTYDETERRRKKRSVGSHHQHHSEAVFNVLTPDTVQELPIALPLIANNNFDPALTLPLESIKAHQARVKRNLPPPNR